MFMEHSGEQLLALLICGGFGIALGLGLDLLTLMTPPRTPRFVAAARDAVAVVIAALAFFLLSLPLTAGRLRWYLFAGAGLGLWAYRATLRRVIMAVGTRVRRWLIGAARWLGGWYDRLVARPLRKRVRNAASRWRQTQSQKPSRTREPSRKTRSKAEKVSKNY